MPNSKRILTWSLRLIGAAELTAVFAVFMPVSLMVDGHTWLGLGTFPDAAIAPYLARHLSAMYVIHGGFLLVASMDVHRYAALIRYICFSGFAFALFITVLDLQTGFPWYWMAAEGPGLGLISAVMLACLQRLPREDGGTVTAAQQD